MDVQLNLTALPLGEISLRDIEIVAGEKVEVSAQFGPSPADRP